MKRIYKAYWIIGMIFLFLFLNSLKSEELFATWDISNIEECDNLPYNGIGSEGENIPCKRCISSGGVWSPTIDSCYGVPNDCYGMKVSFCICPEGYKIADGSCILKSNGNLKSGYCYGGAPGHCISVDQVGIEWCESDIFDNIEQCKEELGKEPMFPVPQNVWFEKIKQGPIPYFIGFGILFFIIVYLTKK